MMRVKGVPLIVLYILICLTGIGYFVTAWQSGTLALWGYSDELVDEGGAIPRYINFAKDVFVLLWAMVLFKKQNHGIKSGRISKDWQAPIAAIIIGGILAFINSNGLMCVVGGIRAHIFAFCTYIYCWSYEFDKKFPLRLSNTMIIMCILQGIGVFIQADMSPAGIQLGSGAYRMMGLFTNGGTLGFFGLGVVLYLGYCFCSGYIKLLKFSACIAIAMVLILASGTRSTFIYAALIALVCFLEKYIRDDKTKIIMVPLLLIVGASIVIPWLTEYVGRGNIMESGSGRFMAWVTLFNELNPLQIIFGTGVGAGTNTARSMDASSIAMDSGFAVIITQFGIWGFILFLNGMIRIFYKAIINSGLKWYAISLDMITFLILFSGSLFEQYTLIVPMVIVYCMCCKDKSIEVNEVK